VRIVNIRSIRHLSTKTHLAFVEILDMLVPGAFDEALQDVDYVMHVAAPIASVDLLCLGVDLAAHFLQPTTNAVLNLLSSAQAHPTVKRIILTSSLAALIDHVTDRAETVHTALTHATNIQPPPYRTPFEAYTAAKITTLHREEQWARLEQPAFDLVHMVPGHVFGPNELITDPAEALRTGSNGIVLAPVTGTASAAEPGVTVHVDDVAEAHVRALDPSTPGNRLYILSSGDIEGTRLARDFLEHVGATLANNGTLPTVVFRVDASESARALGMDFIPYERQVRDTVGPLHSFRLVKEGT
jgi:nucleoside-diphosphate-sugar epimerase